MHKIGKSLKTGLPLIENELKPLLTKSTLIPLVLTSAAATGTTIPKKMFLSGVTTWLILDEDMNIIKTFKSFEESGLLIKGVRPTIKNEAKEQKEGFLNMLLGALLDAALGASLLGNLLTSEGVTATSQGQGTIRAVEGTIWADQNF